MKTNVIFILAISLSIFTSCKEQKTDPEITKDLEEKALSETVIEDEAPILLGAFTRDTLESSLYNKWFMQSYKDHTIDDSALSGIKEHINDVNITVFMGTWCEDSQREVPGFFKILDEINYESDLVKIITISEDKEQPEALLKDQNIMNVPTFVFSKNGTELGRLVEYPLESLEKDITKILSGAAYKHAYEIE